MKEIKISEKENGKRADIGLSAILDISRSQIDQMIKSKKILHFSKKALSKSYILQIDDKFIIDDTKNAKTIPTIDIELLYDDKDIVVVNKPSGVATHAAKSFSGPDVVSSLIAQKVLPKIEDSQIKIDERYLDSENIQPPGIVSRLDVGTSGVLLICKTQIAYNSMLEDFKTHSNIVKNYIAAVQGHLEEKFATIDSPIGRSKKRKFRFAVVENGKRAITHYKVRKSYSAADLVDIELDTGRTHQIRVHFSEMGHPVLGDTFYGASPTLASDYRLIRPFLHSAKLEIMHPILKKKMKFTSSLPDDLMKTLRLLENKEL
ncbi:MAG: RluA family pseudouridine synthase [Bifidobacteriaceae bacterium]|jgi:23S rRNA pseudouridine1911/1915/1917 synthase|nr:RluA family pseudouridine synthase [Bifidobacteriaceae bacterium]